MGPGDLSRALAPLPSLEDSRILVGRESFDDAGVLYVSDELALVQTVDFFAPIVDDPFGFGQIAAANALSDVYAMGGQPLSALNIVGFPAGSLPLEVLTEILRGGQEKVHEAGAVLLGGHSVVDEEIKYGLAVTGRVHPKRLLTNATARVGDRLILTKPIGSGILATALKRGWLDHDSQRRLVAVMSTLNRDASGAALELQASAATDVTGFGLLGHASHVARGSGVTLRFRIADIPLLPGARELWARGARPGGAERNLEFVLPQTEWSALGDEERGLLVDPQTSGGLLVAVPPTQVDDYLARVPGSADVGVVEPRGSTPLIVD